MKNLRRFYKKAFGRVTVTLFLIVIQGLWFLLILDRLFKYYIFLTSVLAVIKIIMAVVVASKNENSAYRIGWILLILIFPIFGIFLYAFFGHGSTNKRARKRYEGYEKNFSGHFKSDDSVIEVVRNQDKQVGNICRYLSHVSGYPIYYNEFASFQPLADEAVELLKEELKKAKEFIFMEYFIIEADGIVFNEILDILEEKVKQGVEVRLLYDDIGSVAYFGMADLKRVKSRGISIKRFNKIRAIFLAFMNNRDHRKITVIDGKVAFTGGYNLADEYVNITHPFGHWKDAGIMIRGAAVDNFTAMFLALWNLSRTEDIHPDKYFGKSTYIEKSDADGYIQPFSDMPLDHERVGEDVYLNIIKTACDYVYIYTPYLIIDNEMMSALCLAAKSGVDIRIVTPGIPDKKMVYQLTQSYYKQLISSGVKIYHYTPGFVHAKVMLCDDEIACVGTINLDYRSLYLHFECGAFMYKCSCIKDIKEDFDKTFDVSRSVTMDFVKKKNIFIRFLWMMLRLFAPLM